MELLYAIYSEEHFLLCGYVIWKTPTGEEVICTAVTSDPKTYGYKDGEVVGMVDKFVRSFKVPYF